MHFFLKLTLLILLLPGFQGCVSNEKKPASGSASEVTGKNLKQITSVGENNAPRFAEDGKTVFFISKKRPQHEKAQGYVFDENTQTEKRITYNDGDVFNIQSFLNDHIIYESTTDEIKEIYAENGMSASFSLESPPSEIYESDLFGANITRLTTSPGFDGGVFLFFSPKPQLLFSSIGSNGSNGSIEKNNKRNIFQMDLSNHTKKYLYSRPDVDQTHVVYLEKLKMFCWIEDALRIECLEKGSKQSKTLKNGYFYIKDLTPYKGSHLLYTLLDKPGGLSKIQSISLDSYCVQDILQAPFGLDYPHYNEKLNRLAFSMKNVSGVSQIYLMDFPDERLKESCQGSSPQTPTSSELKSSSPL